MKSNRRSSFRGYRVKRSIGKVLLITAGLFLLVTLTGFHTEDTLYFSQNPPSEASHFLGRTGALLSALVFYYTGGSGCLLSVLMIFTGYCLFRNISMFRKTMIAVIALCLFVTSALLLQLFHNQPLYWGGGALGRTLYRPVSEHHITAAFVFSLVFGGGVFALIVTAFKGLLQRSNKREPVYASEETAAPSEKKSGVFFRGILFQRSKKAKPPLISRVCFDTQGNIVTPQRRPISVRTNEDGGRMDSTPKPPKRGIEPAHLQVPPNPVGEKMLKRSKSVNMKEREREAEHKSRELEKTLGHFGIEARVIGFTQGPVITRYELEPAPGVKLSRIVSLSDNIALSLSAPGVRIEAPIPGRSAVGIEIPNEEREIVTLGDIIGDAKKTGALPLVLGKDIGGRIIVHDLTSMPHLLIAGATGAGKSVCVNSLIVSLLLQKSPDDLKFIMIDPKMVELKIYNGIPHLLTEVVTDPRNASKVLRWVIWEMENRYRKLDQCYTRDINGYNAKVSKKLPYIVVIVDEFANLMAIAQKEVEDACVRLASMSRAVGIHLIMSTQRPSVDVITGLIKANFPYRIAFQVASKTDSRTILDFSGAEKLLGRGDMLFSPAGSMNIARVQGAYISEDEIHEIVKGLKKSWDGDYDLDILSEESVDKIAMEEDDPMFDEAVEIVLKTKRASASFLQRRLKIGYNRAARLIELMEEKGLIGPPRGSKPREIYADSVD
ncbi:MAG: DNA translocase FtsK 4TM domain-containing protein [Spirochaetes bacterium]|nr:DNA translocase FtsK 4TM domain-containing protein [Spirochaetota bacterium]